MTTGFDYSAGEALVLTQVRATTPYGSTNSARFNWKLLNRGASATYALIRYGGTLEHRPHTYAKQLSTNHTIIEIWQRYKTDTDVLTSLESNFAAVLNRLDSYRLLADSTGKIIDSQVMEISEPEEMWRTRGNGPSWLRASITLRWLEEIDVTYAE